MKKIASVNRLPPIGMETPRRARVITETFPPNEVYLSPPEVRTCTRVVQGLAPVQHVEKLQRHESVIRPTCELKVKGKVNIIKGKVLEPVPEEWSVANDEDSMGMTKVKSTSYEVTLTQRQHTDNTIEKASKVKTTTWWTGPRCTTWWSSCPQMKEKGDFTKEHSFTNNTEI